MAGTKDSCVGMGGCTELWQSSICSPLPAVSPSHASCPLPPRTTLAGQFPAHGSGAPCPSAQLGTQQAASPVPEQCHWAPELPQHTLAPPALPTGNLLHTLCQTLESLPQQLCRVLSPASYLLDFRPHRGTDNVSAATPQAHNDQPVNVGFLPLLSVARGGPGNARARFCAPLAASLWTGSGWLLAQQGHSGPSALWVEQMWGGEKLFWEPFSEM